MITSPAMPAAGSERAVATVAGDRHRRGDGGGEQEQERVGRMAGEVVVADPARLLATMTSTSSPIGEPEHRGPGSLDRGRSSPSARRRTRPPPPHQRNFRTPRGSGRRCGHPECAPDIDDLADEERQRHDGEKQPAEPDLDDLRYPAPD